jgi:hypothetical protein
MANLTLVVQKKTIFMRFLSFRLLVVGGLFWVYLRFGDQKAIQFTGLKFKFWGISINWNMELISLTLQVPSSSPAPKTTSVGKRVFCRFSSFTRFTRSSFRARNEQSPTEVDTACFFVSYSRLSVLSTNRSRNNNPILTKSFETPSMMFSAR